MLHAFINQVIDPLNIVFSLLFILVPHSTDMLSHPALLIVAVLTQIAWNPTIGFPLITNVFGEQTIVVV